MVKNKESLRKGLFIVLILSLITIISLFVFKVVKHEKEAEENIFQCGQIERSMNRNQVIKIMGNPRHEEELTTRINYEDRRVIILYYDAPTGASAGVEIYLDPESLQVVKTICKE